MPWQKNPQDKEKRNKIWKEFDVNGNGIVSLAEVDKGLIDVLNLPALFAIKPVLIRAFNSAKNKVKSKHSYGDDYVSRGEFRLILKYLRMYYEFWVAFERVDTDGDRRITYTEFLMAKSTLEKWGIDMSEPEEMWNEAN